MTHDINASGLPLTDCPFCGGTGIWNGPRYIREGSLYRVMCWGCNAQTGAAQTKDEVADAWNIRDERKLEGASLMTPIERIALALYRADHPAVDVVPSMTMPLSTDWCAYIPRARDVLLAMRDPTDVMVRAGATLSTEPYYSGSQDAAREQWQAMIDAALEQG